MILRDMQVGTHEESSYHFLNEGMVCMYELFGRIISTYKWKSDFGKINIILYPNSINKRTKYGNIIEYEIYFDFDLYISLSQQDRRKHIIELIYKRLLIFASEYELDTTPVEETYKKCIKLNFENKWIHLDKKYTSPKKDYKIQVDCEWNENHLNVYLMQLDKAGQIIKKEFWFDIVSRIGYTIYGCKGSFLDDYTFELSDKFRLNKWKIDIRTLLNI
jgi:hypothetical protein